MNRRPRWSDVPGLIRDIIIAGVLLAPIAAAAGWLVQLTPN